MSGGARDRERPWADPNPERRTKGPNPRCPICHGIGWVVGDWRPGRTVRACFPCEGRSRRYSEALLYARLLRGVTQEQVRQVLRKRAGSATSLMVLDAALEWLGVAS